MASAIPGAAPAIYRASLSKGPGRHRLYRIDPLPGQWWRCEVWGRARGGLHRTEDVPTRVRMLLMKRQYEFEVAELLLDGWILDER